MKEKKKTNGLNNLSASEKSKIKQSKLAIIAGCTVACGILILIVLMFVQKDQLKRSSAETNLAVGNLQEDVDMLDESTADLRAQLEGMLAQLDAMSGVIDQNKSTVESISATAVGSGQNIARVEKEALALQKALNDYIAAFEAQTNSTNENIQNSFNEVNADIENLLKLIDANNKEQTNNYDEISKQMTKTLNDLDKYIANLSKDNESQYEDLAKQIEEFSTTLNEYLENFNTELNETLDSNFQTLNTNIADTLSSVTNDLDSTQKNIDKTREEIIALINEVNEGQTEDLDAKFNAIKTQLQGIQGDQETTLKKIRELIEALSAQNAEEYANTIAALEGVESSLTDLSNENLDKILEDTDTIKTKLDALGSTVAGDIQDLNDDLTDTITNNFNTTNQNINTYTTQTNEKIDNYNTTTNQKIDNYNTTTNQKIENYTTQINNKIESLTWSGTQAEYDALPSHDPNTVYYIIN